MKAPDMPPVRFSRKAILSSCILLLFLHVPFLKASAEPVSQSPRQIDTLLHRTESIHALSGLVNIKIHSPKIRRNIKAAFLLTSQGHTRIDGLSPFGSSLFYLLCIKGSLLLQFSGSGLLFMDLETNKDLTDLLGFPVMNTSLLELVSGCVVTHRTRGEAVLSEVRGGKKFLFCIDSKDSRESLHAELNADFLPRKVSFLKGREKLLTIHYSKYREVNGFPFPLSSLFQAPRKQATIELHFKVVRLSESLPAEKFRVPLNPRATFISREDLLEQLPFSQE